eukprot:scaffold12720_cov152-Cylindrotheca_fusiformis.AAC.2
MGKKNRRNKKHLEDSDNDKDDVQNDTNGQQDDSSTSKQTKNKNKKFSKNMSFEERRDYQRQQALLKRKAKQTCYICGKQGHVRRQCPGIMDDGRGMSAQFQKKSNLQHEKELYHRRGGGGQKQKKKGQQQFNDVHDATFYLKSVEYPEGFIQSSTEQEEEGAAAPATTLQSDDSENVIDLPFVYYDTQCDILGSIEYMLLQRDKKTKLSKSEAIHEYRTVLEHATTVTNLGGMILNTTVVDITTRPWIPPNPLRLSTSSSSSSHSSSFDASNNNNEEEENEKEQHAFPTIPILFVLGLATTVPCSTLEEQEAAQQCLIQNAQEHSEHVVGFFASLDYTTSAASAREEQLERFKCCLQAAVSTQLPLQVQLSPGVPPDNNNKNDNNDTEQSVAGTDYAQVLLDFQATVLPFVTTTTTTTDEAAESDSAPSSSILKLHLVGWHGRSDHTMSLLSLFSPTNNNTINASLYIGLDPSVTFSKATQLHELAFEIPLDRLLLGTSHIIPSDIAKSLGRSAAPHAAWWPFVARAVAEQKKNTSTTLEEVVKAVEENTLTLYPQLAQQRPSPPPPQQQQEEDDLQS